MKLDKLNYKNTRIAFYKSFYETLLILDEADQEEILKAIFKYGFDEIEPTFSNKYLTAIFYTIKEQINSNQAKVKSGTKGGKNKPDDKKEKVIFAE